MPESQEEKEKRHLRELESKNIAHYSVLLSSWIRTRMEHDKTLITLASGGIGLLVTILATVGAKNWLGVLPYVGAFLGFGICIWSSLKLYRLNSEYIEKELKCEDTSELKLKKYDKISLYSFIFGVILFCLVGIVAAGGKIIFKELDNMAKDKETTSLPKTEKVEKSLDGLTNLRPEVPQDQGQSDSSEDSDSSQSNGDSSNKKD